VDRIRSLQVRRLYLNMVKHILAFIFISLASISYAQNKVYHDLSASDFKTKLEATPSGILIDLRTPDETAKGIIPNAIQLDYFRKDFEKEVIKLDKNKTYFLYCASGGRSTETAELMAKHGFKQVYNLKEGFTGWKKQKMPITPR
jgi:phage shock protein E